ncbi:hypothetical protein CVT26_005871 [Gymnopilus dilepis]|uniref:Uncharacterized protein n=1 Tax=Gymnopilus dilepis TaxID=231916 RepID=A0A409Y1Q0_9AGAR|nr:hypothetical protein CVT26_005871 [Gymnopilus dilepis]
MARNVSVIPMTIRGLGHMIASTCYEKERGWLLHESGSLVRGISVRIQTVDRERVELEEVRAYLAVPTKVERAVRGEDGKRCFHLLEKDDVHGRAVELRESRTSDARWKIS